MVLNYFALGNTILFYGLACVLIFHLITHWQDPHKQQTKFSEIAYVLYLFALGTYILFLFDGVPIWSANLFYGILLGWNVAILIWLLVPNILFTYLLVKKHPELRTERDYQKFIDQITHKYDPIEAKDKKDDIIKDLSRKVLHFIQFTCIVLIHVFAPNVNSLFPHLGFSAVMIRNYIYIVIASFFIFMFMVADLYRITNFAYLPDWAHKWYAKSLEPRNELWSFNAAAPILLANLVFIYPIIPTAVMLSATFISCVADALASMVGKFWGKRKLKNLGNHPNKSYEGLLAGMLSSGLGTFIIFTIFPIANISPLIALACGIFAMVVFFYTDAFATKIGDNVLNSLLSGSGFLLLLYIFSL